MEGPRRCRSRWLLFGCASVLKVGRRWKRQSDDGAAEMGEKGRNQGRLPKEATKVAKEAEGLF